MHLKYIALFFPSQETKAHIIHSLTPQSQPTKQTNQLQPVS